MGPRRKSGFRGWLDHGICPVVTRPVGGGSSRSQDLKWETQEMAQFWTQRGWSASRWISTWKRPGGSIGGDTGHIRERCKDGGHGARREGMTALRANRQNKPGFRAPCWTEALTLLTLPNFRSANVLMNGLVSVLSFVPINSSQPLAPAPPCLLAQDKTNEQAVNAYERKMWQWSLSLPLTACSSHGYVCVPIAGFYFEHTDDRNSFC